MDFQFKQVDVFARGPFTGSPVSVVFDADTLDTEQMQQIAKWTNLFATTFVLPPSVPGASYQVRFFTPQAEVPFAGYPAIGTAHALLEAGVVRAKSGVLVQQCAAGLIKLAIANEASADRMVAFDLPDARLQTLNEMEVKKLECALGVSVVPGFPVQMVDVFPQRAVAPRENTADFGQARIVAQLASAEAVLSVVPNLAQINELCASLGSAGLTIFGIHEEETPEALEVRTFSNGHTLTEEPICSSVHGGVAVYVRNSQLTEKLGPIFASVQRVRGGIHGTVHLEIESAGKIRIGGKSITRVDGCIYDC